MAVVALVLGWVPAAGQEEAGARCASQTDGLFRTPELREREHWYGTYLKAAEEADLCEEAAGFTEVYRFTWLRTFHPPVVVRIGRSDSSFRLVAKKLDGKGGYEPGRLVVDRSMEIGPDEWQRVRRMLEEADFWTSPPRLESDRGGVDGAQWIFEGVRGARYWAVDRWSPEHSDYRRLGVYLLKLAGLLPSDEKSVY